MDFLISLIWREAQHWCVFESFLGDSNIKADLESAGRTQERERNREQ
jgi:hypothetical protein